MRHAEPRVRGEAVVHVGCERPVRPFGHQALLVEEGQDAGRLRFDEGDAARMTKKQNRTKNKNKKKTRLDVFSISWFRQPTFADLRKLVG